MAIHWQVKFRSLRANTLYTVSIYDDNYSGSTPVQLKGGEHPFTTEEDNDDDFFTPVRTQSGYLRIVDDGKDFLFHKRIGWLYFSSKTADRLFSAIPCRRYS